MNNPLQRKVEHMSLQEDSVSNIVSRMRHSPRQELNAELMSRRGNPNMEWATRVIFLFYCPTTLVGT